MGSKIILIIVALNSDLEILTFHPCSTTLTHFKIFNSSFGMAKWRLQNFFWSLKCNLWSISNNSYKFKSPGYNFKSNNFSHAHIDLCRNSDLKIWIFLHLHEHDTNMKYRNQGREWRVKRGSHYHDIFDSSCPPASTSPCPTLNTTKVTQAWGGKS